MPLLNGVVTTNENAQIFVSDRVIVDEAERLLSAKDLVLLAKKMATEVGISSVDPKDIRLIRIPVHGKGEETFIYQWHFLHLTRGWEVMSRSLLHLKKYKAGFLSRDY